jgi:predicted amidophosphoribosyltransferase
MVQRNTYGAGTADRAIKRKEQRRCCNCDAPVSSAKKRCWSCEDKALQERVRERDRMRRLKRASTTKEPA